jgi:hypothetical protein
MTGFLQKSKRQKLSVHIIRKSQLIPLQAGDVTLDPLNWIIIFILSGPMQAALKVPARARRIAG